MAGGGAVRITGLRETVRRLERLGVETQDIKAAFTRIATTVTVKAVAKVAKKSGRLAASIRPSKTKNKAVVRAGYASRAPHAGPINYGWPARGIKASYFLTGPANEDTDQHINTIEAELSRLADRIGF